MAFFDVCRKEGQADYAAIDLVNNLAFKETAQSQIIRELRQTGEALWSQVLLKGDEIIGHLMFYKVWLKINSPTGVQNPLNKTFREFGANHFNRS